MSTIGTVYQLEPGAVPERTTLRRIDALTRMMDTALPIPFSQGATVGLDAALGVFPIIGDALSMAMSAFLINEARRLGAPRPLLAKMLVNAGIDGAIGMIPVLGDLFDVFFRANERNLRLLRIHLEQNGRLFPMSPNSEAAH